MNKTYRLIWNEAKSTWMVVGEKVKACGKRASGTVSTCAAASLVVLSSQALAAPPVTELPTGGNVVAGQANINQSGLTMNINQTTNRAAVNWNTFNVGSDATVNFNQPSANSVTLNRVQSGNASQIFGQINANGQVFLTNPNGAYFAPGASVNVGGLMATTHSISNDDFMAGNYTFNRDGAEGSIINEGDLTAELGGYIALLAPEVRNQGVIIADLGTVALAAGESYDLAIDNNGTLTSLQVEPATIDALVENRHAVKAAGGLVIFSSQSINTLQGGVINNTGTIEATGISHDGGRIILEASNSISHTGTIEADAAMNSSGDGGSVILIADLDNLNSQTVIDGSISAQAGELGGNGGFIETSASHLTIGENTRISTHAANGESGTWLLDPVDFTIAASGGDMTGATLSSSLGSGNVSIASTSGGSGTAGDVNVNDAVSWSANKLTLNAQNDININSDMTATGTASLALEYGQAAVELGNTSNITTTDAKVYLPASTTNFTTKLGSDGGIKSYTVITSLGTEGSTTTTDLQGMVGDRTLNYALGADINALATGTWNSGAGFEMFSGAFLNAEFDGLGHTITDIYINRSGTANIGLFGTTYNASVRNVGLVGGSISGTNNTGALIGTATGTKVHNSFSSATVVGTTTVGGLVGLLQESAFTDIAPVVSYSYSSGNVTATAVNGSAGGLVGSASIASGQGTDNPEIIYSYATGDVAGAQSSGGLLGQCASCIISDSYAEGSVTLSGGNGSGAGGLVGIVNGSNAPGTQISDSYATGDVTANGAFVLKVGGLVGSSSTDVTVTRSFAIGAVLANDGGDQVGGLIGYMDGTTVSNSYAQGSVSGDGQVGGLIGDLGTAGASFSNNYATGAITGTSTGGLIGLNRPSALVTASFWDTETSGQASSDGGTGKTTAEMQTKTTFNTGGATWDIGGSATGAYPTLTFGGATIWTIDATTLVSYALSAINNGDIYLGSEYALNDLWGATAIFGGSYNGWIYDTDYRFSYSAGTVTGFTDAGTYSNISVDVIKAGFDEQVAGSTVGSFVITPKTLTMSGLTSANKVYDGTITAVIAGTETLQAFEAVGAGTALDGKGYTGDTVSLTGTAAGTFNDSNVATATTVSFSGLSLTGAQAGNYILSEHATASHSITAKALTIAGLVADNKVYDGTDTATISSWGTVATGVGTETVVLNNGTAGTFINENVGASKLVVATGYTLGDGTNGGLASNYSVNAAATLADITKKDITADTITANNKVYDGTNAATLSALTSSGFIGGDDISLESGSNIFDDENVGTAKTVTVGTIALAGNDSSNYNLTSASATTTANITEKPLENSTDTTPPPPPQAYSVTSEAQSSPETGLVLGSNEGGVSVSLESMPSLGDSGIIAVTIPKGSSTSGAGFSFSLPEELAESVKSNDGDVQVSLPSGEVLPSWLTFNQESLTFTSGAVPDRAFPLQISVTIGNEQFTIVISERAEDE